MTTPAPAIGAVFGNLTVLSKPHLAQHSKQRMRHVQCRCICGRTSTPTLNNLIHGRSKSCPDCGYQARDRHLRRTDRPTHRLSQLLEYAKPYRVWREGMRLKIPDFQDFLHALAGRGYLLGQVIYRKDYTKPWSMGNLAIAKTKADIPKRRNARATYITWGNESKSLRAWAKDERCPVSYQALYNRYRKGLRPETDLFAPARLSPFK